MKKIGFDDHRLGKPLSAVFGDRANLRRSRARRSEREIVSSRDYRGPRREIGAQDRNGSGRRFRLLADRDLGRCGIELAAAPGLLRCQRRALAPRYLQGSSGAWCRTDNQERYGRRSAGQVLYGAHVRLESLRRSDSLFDPKSLASVTEEEDSGASAGGVTPPRKMDDSDGQIESQARDRYRRCC